MDTSIKILIVDDFATMRRILKNALKQLGFRDFVEADDGTTAWKVLEEQQFDLIVADWNMPKLTGFELLKKVRASDLHKKTPFLMVTAEAQKDQVVKAIHAGASNYVVKPFTEEIIANKLERILN
ncbi:MAG: response regulator [Desulfobacteraceae bacterium]|nr:response regulator [Desulfobacteraceae bacterium]